MEDKVQNELTRVSYPAICVKVIKARKKDANVCFDEG